jgi:hypothetical protein
MNYSLVRKERILKLEKRLARIENALKNFPYTSPKQWLEDFGAYTDTEKEIQIQKAYLVNEA